MNEKSPFTKEILYYLQKAEKKLSSATLLLDQGFYEDAVSRAYYAAFHAIVALLRVENVDLSQHKHAFILNQFRIYFIDTQILSSDLYSKILNIKAIREHADYSINTEIEQLEAEQIINDTRTLVDKIKEYLEQMKDLKFEEI
jgi:uncharacterized protein (UPF0332 family)